MTLQKCFPRPTCLLSPNPTYKTQPRTEIRWEIINSKSLGQITLIGQSETSAYLYQQNNHVHYALLWQVLGVRLSCAFYRRQETMQKY